MNEMAAPTTATNIPRRPLLWLSAALLFTVPPMFDTLAAWVPACFFAALLAKFWMEKSGVRLRSQFLKIAGIAAGTGGVFLSYDTLKGFEPSLAALLVLAAFKLLEAHTARDFHILVLIGWFLCLCGFFGSQDLGVALYVLAAFGLLLAAMIQFHRGPSARGVFWPPLRVAGKLLLQAAPLVAILFVLFPRGSGGFHFFVSRAPSQSIGMSDRLSPGSVASIATSQQTAFWVEFPDGEKPPPAALYWRGLVMWRGDAMNWLASPLYNVQQRVQPLSGPTIQQRITVEPHGERWMFALDWPGKAPPGAALTPGNCLRSAYPITSPRQYEVRSFRQMQPTELDPAERQICLQIPASISPAVRALVQSWTAQSRDPRALVQSALQFFQKGGFRYSLSPGEYRENALDDFLFHRKLGFCEHFAASFATLMRVAGVPSRVVVGYQGGQFNDFGRYLVVRQADAHAWCEVWLPNAGWKRVDPTSVVAPERISLGLDSFLEMQGANSGAGATAGRSGGSGMTGTQRLLLNTRLAWNMLNYVWDTHVLSFDTETQQALFEEAGIENSTPTGLIVSLVFALAAVLGCYALWLWLRTRARLDPVKMLYERFCRRAAKLGAKRSETEGPVDFSERAARLLPNEAERIRRLTNLYVALRYAPQPSATMLKNFADEVKAFPPRNRRNVTPNQSS